MLTRGQNLTKQPAKGCPHADLHSLMPGRNIAEECIWKRKRKQKVYLCKTEGLFEQNEPSVWNKCRLQKSIRLKAVLFILEAVSVKSFDEMEYFERN